MIIYCILNFNDFFRNSNTLQFLTEFLFLDFAVFVAVIVVVVLVFFTCVSLCVIVYFVKW